MIDFHTHRPSPAPEGHCRILSLAANGPTEGSPAPTPPYTLGLHPWHLRPGVPPDTALAVLTDHPLWGGAVGVGECGLDRAIAVPLAYQEAVFRAQIRLSEETRRPLIIHCVRAFDRLLALRRAERPRMPWAVHGFSKNPQTAAQLWSSGMYTSFGRAILRPGAPEAQALAAAPDGLFFLETDGMGAETRIEAIYAQAAALRGVEVGDLVPQVARTAAAFWGHQGIRE